MYDVITIGGASLDIYLESGEFKKIIDNRFPTGQAKCFPLGSKIEIDETFFETGGGGTNSAYTFSKLGLATAFLGKVGNDLSGQEIIKVLEKQKISTDLVKIAPQIKTAISIIILDSKGEKTILIYRGAEESLSKNNILFNKLNAKWFYISSLAGNIDLLKKIVEYAKERNIHIALNPGKKELDQKDKIIPIVAKVDILLLNLEEAQQITGQQEIDQIFPKIYQNFDGVAIITLGAAGSVAADKNQIYQIKTTTKKETKDTTGAGDAFGSAFVAGIIMKKDIPACLQLATANARSAIKKIGAKQGLLEKIPKTYQYRVKTKNFSRYSR